MTPTKRSVAFFGATGGSILACLTLALKAGYNCSALSRSSSKLQTLLLERSISQATLNTHLTIIRGDIRDLQSVSQTLSPSKPGTTNHPVDSVVSGIGRPPIFAPNPLNPTFDDPTICQDAIRTILAALRNLPASPPKPKPWLFVLSTTGISSRVRDVPFLLTPLYHWVLAVPHKDKKEMEAVLLAEASKPASDRDMENFVILRPSLLTNGARLGSGQIRVGEEDEIRGTASPAVGYTISREDVGGWLFDELVDGKGKEKYAGKMVSITY
ncbi:MAG: hypothetical protein L6R38_002694 [Xanthoria sp. 2 TBL-2021]|nr:MAG: hypothetical protein L6R38_002694 [Xanthoria sp. 2 TBL-2021]